MARRRFLSQLVGACENSCYRRKARERFAPGPWCLIDVVLLPVEGGVGLDDYVFVRGLFQFVH
jgi:hypothetical protein